MVLGERETGNWEGCVWLVAILQTILVAVAEEIQNAGKLRRID